MTRIQQGWILAGLVGLSACGGGGDADETGAAATGGGQAETSCVSDLEFFQRNVQVPILDKTCYACHNAQGTAKDSKLVLSPAGQTDFLRLNFERLREVGSYEVDATSILLLKPTATITHGGGPQLEVDSAEYKALQALVARFNEPVVCQDTNEGGVLAKVRLLDLPSTLRRAKLLLVGELPTADELQRVSDGGEPVFDSLVAEYLTAPAFYGNLETWFNDLVLTDKYLGGDNATNLLDGDIWPNRHDYRDLPEDSPEGQADRRWSNDSVAREPLKLISHVVRNDRPFSDILTANYMLLNPFSARVYGANDVRFDDPLDPGEWREVRLPNYPHSGVLTSPMFLNRFPTTDTNVNRHRSRMVWKLFLATDVLKLADRPVDPTVIKDHNPTMNNEQCSVCHAQVDPLAGAFMNWDPRGRYDAREAGWIESMLPPGFGDARVPPEEWPSATSWLGRTISRDPRFALAAVHTVYTALIGRTPVETPTDATAPGYATRLEFASLETAFLDTVAQAMIAADLDLKAIFPVILRSPYFRAQATHDLTEEERAILGPLGATRLLTPEQLDAKLRATFGHGWRRAYDQTNQLLARDQFLYFYGGIDSDNVTRRITDPNGMMANIGLRLGSEMACLTVAQDFSRPVEERILFPHVLQGYAPEDPYGFDVPEAIEAIKKNIRYLHFRILGELLPPGHPELERTWQLFLETYRELYAAGRNQQISQDLHGMCQATRDPLTGEPYTSERKIDKDGRFIMRTWMAVVAYLVSDWRFLYHQ